MAKPRFFFWNNIPHLGFRVFFNAFGVGFFSGFGGGFQIFPRFFRFFQIDLLNLFFFLLYFININRNLTQDLYLKVSWNKSKKSKNTPITSIHPFCGIFNFFFRMFWVGGFLVHDMNICRLYGQTAYLVITPWLDNFYYNWV